MENKNYKMIIWAMLVALVLIAVPTAIQLGPETVGKKFVDSQEFQDEVDSFYESLSTAVLNPIDIDTLKEKISVTTSEIEEHRRRYGELSDQILNIQVQYEDRIFDAEGNDQLKRSLEQERDQKIADIEMNFESDDHVHAKVLEEKIEWYKEYIANRQMDHSASFPVAYEFTDVDTGETFSKGDLSVPLFYSATFSKESPFIAQSFKGNDHEWVMDSAGREYEIDLSTIENPTRFFTGKIIVSEKAVENSYLNGQLKQFNQKKYRSYILWIAALIALILLFTKLKFKKEWVIKNRFVPHYEKLKVDIKLFLFMISLFFFVEMVIPNATSRFFYDDIYRGAWPAQLFWFVVLTVGVIWMTAQLVLLLERLQKTGQLEADLMDSYTVQFMKDLGAMFLNRSLGIQLFILLIGFFLAGVGFTAVAIEPYNLIVYFPAVVFLGLPALYMFVRRGAYLNRIFAATEKMANGKLQEKIKVKGKSSLAKHAQNLNELQEGVRISMTEQAKSERLKTELITNVSHDLRTPLTSIITYTDLLKAKDLSEEERLKYVDILDKKSARLKTLIEDLFEVSKMASGSLELNKRQVDFTQLLQQALAEHEEEITKSSLDFRIQLPETALIANVDGQRWWRVLDNLIVNALKYSMSGTRVYVTLDKVNDRARFVVKNISQYELHENSDELFERFKRADTSRHTDGSGLGLAIAQSIVDMHDGEMKIEVDGDLFKVTVDLPI